jgi:glycosyltransferase involved in cell wall biosynthesis
MVPRPEAQAVSISPPSCAERRRVSEQGYVELPYTLPQDSTLFLLLREPTPAIWLRKLDWIAQRGGMALLNVHPDYLRFPGEAAAPQTFPVEHYVQLLQHVRKNYAGAYWQPLAREMADICSAIRPPRPKAQRKVGMITYSVYQRDNRVMRYAEALAERGDTVEVLALKNDPGHAFNEKLRSVQVYRFGGRYGKNQKNRGEYLLPLLGFWAAASAFLTWKHLRNRYHIIHVHNMPDFMVFAAWFPRLTGAKVMLDIHDIMPEFYASKFHKNRNALGVRLLKAIELAAARFAQHIIISNHLWLKPFTARSAPEGKCSVFINHVNQDLFHHREPVGKRGKPIILFPGGLQWHQGLDIAIRAMPAVIKQIPAAELHIYGDGNMKDDLVKLAHSLGLGETVRFFDPRPLSQIADIMAGADLGIVPKRADSFGNEAYSTKIMEFMSLGVPMVVSSTKIDRYYFDDSVVRFFESGNPEAFAAAVMEVLQNEKLRRRLIANALVYAERNSWNCHKGHYLELVDALIENRACQMGNHSLGSQPGLNKETDHQSPAGVETGQLAVK